MTAPIIVPVVADTTGLDVGLAKAQTSIGQFAGFAKGLAISLGTIFVSRQVVDLIDKSVGLFEDLNDANDKLKVKLGDSADAVIALEEKMSAIGLSSVEVGTLAGIVADLGISAGIAAPQVATFVEPTLRAAAALASMDPTHTLSVADAVTAIGKAASTGNLKALQALGVDVDTAATAAARLDSNGKELPKQIADTAEASARWDAILASLNPAVERQASGVQSLGDKQATLNAKWDTFLAKIGGPISSVFSFILDTINFILEGIAGWLDLLTVKLPAALGALAGVIGRTIGAAFTAIGTVIDTILRRIHEITAILPNIQFPNLPFGIFGPGGPGVGGAGGGGTYTYNLNTGADPSAVVRALRAWARDNGGPGSVWRGVDG